MGDGSMKLILVWVVVVVVGEQEEEAVALTEEATGRLAVMNMDWEHVRVHPLPPTEDPPTPFIRYRLPWTDCSRVFFFVSGYGPPGAAAFLSAQGRHHFFCHRVPHPLWDEADGGGDEEGTLLPHRGGGGEESSSGR